MTTFVIAVQFLSVFGVFVHAIHVPGENIDKKTLTSLGIKTIGWQNSESTTTTPDVDIYHNYSKISLQNENVENYSQYTQPQTSYDKKPSKLQAGVKTGRVNPFPSQTTSGQEEDSDLKGSSSSHTGQEREDSSNFNSWNGAHAQTSRDNSNKFTSQTYQTTSGNAPTSNYQKQPSAPSANSQKYKSTGGYQNSLELSKIIESEKHNQASQTFLDYDQQTSETNYRPEKFISGPSNSKQIYTNKALEYNNGKFEKVYSTCPEMATGQFIYQSSCQQFLNCWKGRGFVQNCPAGTLFNPQTLECDFASKVKCITGPNSLHSEEYREFNSEFIHKAGIECPPEFSGVVPHKTDCSKFINCANGVQNIMDCPPGTLFSLQINSCDYAYKAECAGWSVEFGDNDLTYDTQDIDVRQLTRGKTTASVNAQGTQWSSQSGVGNQNGYAYNSNTKNQNQFGSQVSNTNTHYQGSGYVSNQNGYHQNTNYGGASTNTYHSGSGSYQNGYSESESTLQQSSIKNQNTNYKTSGIKSSGSVSNQNGYHVGSGTPTPGQNSNYGGFNTGSGFEYNQNGDYKGSESSIYQSTQTGHNNIHNEEIVNENVHYGTQQGVDRTPRCPHGASGLFPHPTICAKFLNCANGQMFIQDCGPGTVFNPSTMVCDFPYNVECSDYRNIIDVRAQPKSPPHGTGGSNYNTQQNSGDKIEEAGSNIHGVYVPGDNTVTHGNVGKGTIGESQNVVLDDEVLCPNHPVGFYPHPTVCAKYFTCSNNGRPTIYKCGSGMVFNPLTKVCDIPKKVKCFHSTSNIDGNGKTNQYQEQSSTNTNTYSNSGTHQLEGTYNQNNQQPNNNNKPPGGSLEGRGKFKDVCDIEDFYCSEKLCIPKTMVCDGTKDCPNGIDEESFCGGFLDQFVSKEGSVLAMREKERYSNISLVECAKSCLDAKGFRCKSFSYRTDSECFLSDTNIGLCGALIEAEPYSYYELEALTVDCSDMYKCPNNKCINHTQVCDGVNDCGDRTDEKGCHAEAFGYEIRLAGSNNKHEGRIELKAFGKLGYICDDRFGMRDADVACHELGFPLGALEIKGSSYYAKEVDTSDVLYLMDDVVCLGNETSLKDCEFNGWGVSNCEPTEIVGVVCKTPVEKCPKDQFKCDTVQECVPLAFVCDNVFDCPDQSDEATRYCEAAAEIRLVNGKTEREGRIEIRHHGIWGTICDDDFNDDAAKVVCNTLGFPGKAAVKKDGFFGEGEGPIWLDQVFCQGNETLLEECTHWNWGEHNCEHAEDVGVVCSSSGLSSSPNEIETEKKSNIDAPLNIVEVPPEELFPNECGLRKNAVFYVDEVHFRVVSGTVAKKGFYPWQASLRIKNTAKPTHWCGAVVISKKFVLTAAHCLRGFTKGSYVVVAGDYNTDDDEGTEQEIYIEEFYIHDDFGKEQKMNNDIALIKLKGNGFTFTKDIQPICLPETSLSYTNQLNCTISGFGSVQTGKSGYSHDLRAGWVPIQPPSVCKMPHVYGTSITDGMFCAGSLDEGVDACEGDSGGPLACLHNGVFTLYGITSWGQHCGHANKPGVYVKVSHYRNWIEQTMKKGAT